ncbi:hypothetical protein PVAND_008586 [Polypedilum vanderplanki]|uniref:RING-type E3 ubiquitin transferase n=1 Tax=Polypedilum vanderplanki TaxID=319348 RepID=A0A9J6CB50_POLVA|nr:hypothetical protein PVAND_008586 [Polypedilum vanderplanki]
MEFNNFCPENFSASNFSLLNPNAEIFVPRSRQIDSLNCQNSSQLDDEQNDCPQNDNCSSQKVNKNLCEICGCFSLHPTNEFQQKNHQRICSEEINQKLEFSIQQSKNKVCGICFDVVYEKSQNNQKFGILSGCKHCFCLDCIENWRKTNLESSVTKTCPECRVYSQFIYPSSFWIDDIAEKDKILTEYKNYCAQKDCKHFKGGFGICPYREDCIFQHRLIDRRIDDDEEQNFASSIWQNVQRRMNLLNSLQRSAPRMTVIPFTFDLTDGDDFTFYFPNFD